MTLVELLVGIGILIGAGGALCMGMTQTTVYADYLRQFQVAVNAAQGKLEELAVTDFDTLLNGAQFQAARTAQGQCMGLGEDVNCNGVLDPGEDVANIGVLDEPIQGARLTVQIRPSPPTASPVNLLDIHIAACWQHRGRPIGEDVNCNGLVDAGEDNNPTNNWVDSPAMMSTRVARRN